MCCRRVESLQCRVRELEDMESQLLQSQAKVKVCVCVCVCVCVGGGGGGGGDVCKRYTCMC